MEDGTKVTDCCYKIWIIMDEDKTPLLEQLIKRFVLLLKQEAILCEVMEWSGKFIGPE